MGRRVGGGLSWLMVATVVVKAFSLVNIAVLGILLAEEDFGVFATAIGVAALVNVLRDGGVRRILIQKGVHRYDGLIGPIYAWPLMLNLIAAFVLCALGPVIAWIHGDDQYVMVMVTIGLAAAIYGPGMIYRATLSMQYRYKAVAALNATSALVNYIAMITLAIGGAGPLTFTWAMVVVAAYDWAFGYALTRQPLIRFSPRTRLWPAIWARTRWLILGAMALALLRQGDFLVLGFILDPAMIGIYAFAYMISSQVLTVLAASLQQVLMPTMSSFQHDRTRHSRAVLRVCGSLTLVAAVFSGGIAVVFDPLQELIWGGKWLAAVPAVQALALCFALRLLVAVQESALSSTGRFQTQFQALLIQGIGMVIVAAIGGMLFPRQPHLIAMGVGLWFVVGLTGVTSWSLKKAGVPMIDFLVTVLRPWGALTVLAMLVILVDLWLHNLGMRHALESASAGEPSTLDTMFRCVASGFAFTLAAAVLVRFAMPQTLSDMLSITPPRIARLARPILRLRPDRQPESE